LGGGPGGGGGAYEPFAGACGRSVDDVSCVESLGTVGAA
jgi:hypothetical protein